MGILSWLIVGLIVGGLASLVLSDNDDLAADVVLGISGALLGGFLASALLGIRHPLSGVIVGSVLAAFLGALVLVAIAGALSGQRVH